MTAEFCPDKADVRVKVRCLGGRWAAGGEGLGGPRHVPEVHGGPGVVLREAQDPRL